MDIEKSPWVSFQGLKVLDPSIRGISHLAVNARDY